MKTNKIDNKNTDLQLTGNQNIVIAENRIKNIHQYNSTVLLAVRS